jgi:hypothetical protein
MTSSCTYTWSITSGPGDISTGSTSTATYTPPTSGTGTANIKVSAIKTGTTTPVKTATTTVGVTAATTPSTTADPTKLSVSAQRDTAIYTDVPSGGYVDVYTFDTDAVDSAEAAGIKFHITTSGVETNTYGGSTIGSTDNIYFQVYSGSSWTNMTSDGKIPVAPNSDALGSIQATSPTIVSSSAAGAGNLLAGEKIRCYEGEAEPYWSHSTAATTIGEDMTITALVAGDEPFYTRTNADGHESVVSSKDGKTLILTGATGANKDGGTAGTLETGDTITLTYDGNVNVNLPIYIENITWTATQARFGTALEKLKDTETTDSTGVVLTARTCTNFADSAEKVTFNVPTDNCIVDVAGGNFVFKCATDFEFDSADF